MSVVIVHAPVSDFTGEVAGCAFARGAALVDRRNRSALQYFRRHGYTVDGERNDERTEVLDPRSHTEEVVGTKLRDAAVDPRPEDYLPPTNAGQANPHGPLVVSPEIEGPQGRRGTLPPTTAGSGTPSVPGDTEPTKSAQKSDWVDFALSQGANPEDLKGLTRDALVEKFATKG